MAQCFRQTAPQYGGFPQWKTRRPMEFSPGITQARPLRPGLSGLSSATPQRRRFSAASGLHWPLILWKRSSYVDGVILSCLKRESGCLGRTPRSLIFRLGENRCRREPCCFSWYWNHGSLHVHEDAKDQLSHCATETSRLERLHETAETRTGVGRAILRAFLLAMACACLFSTRIAYAADTGLTLLPSLVQRSKDTFGIFGPKLIQVLGVLRDQGLLLSVLLGVSAFFSMAETSITTLWPWKVRELAEKEKEGGVFQLLRQDVTRFLTTILIGTTVANIAATALVTDAATALFGQAGVTAATGVMTVVILLLTEITPKSIAVHNATEVARFVVRPVAWLSYILYPVGRVVTGISMSLLKLLGLKSSGEPFVTEEELKLMLRGAELSGSIEEEEQDMIENVLEIKDTYVREVMTPLVDVVAIDTSATLMDFRNLWVTHQYSRVPVFERRVDNIVGIAFAMDMLDYVEQAELLQRLTVGRIAHKPAYFVPDSMSVWNLLREFRIRKVHMAIVLNEYGGTVGVVTLEDVVEEIVGEIFDENDSKEEIRRKTGYVVQRVDGSFDVDANTSIEDLTEALDVKIHEGPYHYETVSGFVCEVFGYIPRTGESIKVILKKADSDEGSDRREGETEYQEDRREKYQKFRLEILAGNARKVGSVRFKRLDGSEYKGDAETVTRVVPRILRRPWEDQQCPGNEKIDDSDGKTDMPWDADEEPSEQLVSDDEDDICIADKGTPKNRYLIADSVDVDSVDVDSVSESGGSVTSGLTVIGNEEWDMETMDDRVICELKTDDIDISTATAVDTLNKKWEKHEGLVERRQQRRRKQSAEAAVELDKHRKVHVRRKEAVMAMMLRRKHDEQTEQGHTSNNGEM